MASPEKHPFFTLVNTQCEAEAAIAAIECFSEYLEKQYLKPQISQIKRDFYNTEKQTCLAQRVNTLLAQYLENIGDLSDQLMIYISKSLHTA